MDRLTFDDLHRDPDIATCTLALRSGEEVTFRLLTGADGDLLGRYLGGLTGETERLYRPHTFDMETGHRLCADIDYARAMRFVAVSRAQTPRILAYFIVQAAGEGDLQRYADRGMPLDPAAVRSLAPSVAEDLFSQGVGSCMMPPILEALRRLRIPRMILDGGVQARNERAQGFYAKFGFRCVGDFRTRNPEDPDSFLDNHDMIMEIPAAL